MAIQTYTIGQTLTAAQMTALQANDYNQTVSTKTASYTLVAADAGTRVVMNVSSASTVTVNTSLFSAGDTLVIQNIASNATVVTAGSATVSTAGSLSIPQYGSGILYFTSASAAIFFPSAGPAASSALNLVYSNTFSGTTVTLSNVFSATYRNYKVQMSNVIPASGSPLLRFRFDSATAHYYNLLTFTANTTGTVDAFGSGVDFITVAQLGSTASRQNGLDADILSPFLQVPTGLTSFSSGFSTGTYRCTAVETAEASYTSLVLSNATGVSMSGSIQIYGYGL